MFLKQNNIIIVWCVWCDKYIDVNNVVRPLPFQIRFSENHELKGLGRKFIKTMKLILNYFLPSFLFCCWMTFFYVCMCIVDTTDTTNAEINKNRMNSIPLLKHCFPLLNHSHTHGSTCRQPSVNITRSMRNVCHLRRNGTAKMNYRYVLVRFCSI